MFRSYMSDNTMVSRGV